jgi:hypothetical protein
VGKGRVGIKKFVKYLVKSPRVSQKSRFADLLFSWQRPTRLIQCTNLTLTCTILSPSAALRMGEITDPTPSFTNL